MNEGLVKALGEQWLKYFEAFQTNTLLVNPTGTAAFQQMEHGALAVDSQQYALLQGYANFQQAMRESASRFKNFNASASSKSSSSSSSSSAAEKELYESKLYEQQIAKLDQQLKNLDYTKSKLSKNSQTYRDALQQEINLMQQKQKLTHEEAERLRNQKSSKISEINKIAVS